MTHKINYSHTSCSASRCLGTNEIFFMWGAGSGPWEVLRDHPPITSLYRWILRHKGNWRWCWDWDRMMTLHAPMLCSIYWLICRQGERWESSLCFFHILSPGSWRKLSPLQGLELPECGGLQGEEIETKRDMSRQRR